MTSNPLNSPSGSYNNHLYEKRSSIIPPPPPSGKTSSTALSDLVNQYRSIEATTAPTTSSIVPPPSMTAAGYRSSSSTSPMDMSLSSSSTKPWYIRYMLYWVLFLWTVIMLFVLQPKIMYTEDPITKERTFNTTRFFITLTFTYLTNVGLIILIQWFINRQPLQLHEGGGIRLW